MLHYNRITAWHFVGAPSCPFDEAGWNQATKMAGLAVSMRHVGNVFSAQFGASADISDMTVLLKSRVVIKGRSWFKLTPMVSGDGTVDSLTNHSPRQFLGMQWGQAVSATIENDCIVIGFEPSPARRSMVKMQTLPPIQAWELRSLIPLQRLVRRFIGARVAPVPAAEVMIDLTREPEVAAPIPDVEVKLEPPDEPDMADASEVLERRNVRPRVQSAAPAGAVVVIDLSLDED